MLSEFSETTDCHWTHSIMRFVPVIGKLTYCDPAWSGLLSANDHALLDTGVANDMDTMHVMFL